MAVSVYGQILLGTSTLVDADTYTRTHTRALVVDTAVKGKVVLWLKYQDFCSTELIYFSSC